MNEQTEKLREKFITLLEDTELDRNKENATDQLLQVLIDEGLKFVPEELTITYDVLYNDKIVWPESKKRIAESINSQIKEIEL